MTTKRDRELAPTNMPSAWLTAIGICFVGALVCVGVLFSGAVQ